MIANPSRLLVVSVMISALLTLGATPAGSHGLERTDPDDVPGLDTRTVGYRHEDGKTFLKLEFYDTPLQSQFGDTDVLFNLDTRRGDNTDAFAEFRYGTDPEGYFCYIRNNFSELIKAVPIVKRGKTMKCNFKSKLVGGVAEGFWVDVYAGSKDFAPDISRYHHN